MKVLADLKKIKKILNEGWTGTVFYCFLGLVIALAVHEGLGLTMGTDLPIVTVSSRSMVPNLRVGDIALIRNTGKYEVGDIIVFDGWERKPIIHRIVAIKEDNKVTRLGDWHELSDKELLNYEGKIYITKGDNNPSCDQCTGKEPVKKTEIHGEKILVIPYLGWVKILFVEYFIKTPIIGIGSAIVVMIIYWLYKKW